MNRTYLELLNLLHSNKDKFISGEDISNKLGVSRTTIWKYVNKLRDKGYIIESVTNRGYSLRQIPEKLLVEEVKYGLVTSEIGNEIIFYDKVNSTNVKARELARKGCESGTVVLTKEQTAGKGRLGRKWFSPPGSGLWFSVILRPDLSPVKAPYLTIVASLAVEEVIKGLIEDENDVKTKIKWPNDILIDGKKVAGILSEVNTDMDRIKYAVVGIGININLNSFPSEIEGIATSLKKSLNREFNRGKILQSLLCKLEKYYFQLIKGREEELLKLWKNNLHVLGRKVRIHNEKRIFKGIVKDISSRGELVLEDKHGDIHTFWAGDVSLRAE